MVFKPDPTGLKIISRNKLDDGCMASPAVVGDSLSSAPSKTSTARPALTTAPVGTHLFKPYPSIMKTHILILLALLPPGALRQGNLESRARLADSSQKEKLGNMHGDIAVSSTGDVYVSVGDPKAGLQVYGDDGKWKRNVKGAPSDLHGFVIRKEKGGEFIYSARVNGSEVLKMDMAGKTVLSIKADSIPNEFKRKGRNGEGFVKLTGVDVGENGDIFVTDGYASDHIHRFDKSGKYLNSFGGKNAPYGFRTLHKLVIDHRSHIRILGMGRANNRVIHLGWTESS